MKKTATSVPTVPMTHRYVDDNNNNNNKKMSIYDKVNNNNNKSANNNNNKSVNNNNNKSANKNNNNNDDDDYEDAFLMAALEDHLKDMERSAPMPNTNMFPARASAAQPRDPTAQRSQPLFVPGIVSSRNAPAAQQEFNTRSALVLTLPRGMFEPRPGQLTGRQNPSMTRFIELAASMMNQCPLVACRLTVPHFLDECPVYLALGLCKHCGSAACPSRTRCPNKVVVQDACYHCWLKHYQSHTECKAAQNINYVRPLLFFAINKLPRYEMGWFMTEYWKPDTDRPKLLMEMLEDVQRIPNAGNQLRPF